MGCSVMVKCNINYQSPALHLFAQKNWREKVDMINLSWLSGGNTILSIGRHQRRRHLISETSHLRRPDAIHSSFIMTVTRRSPDISVLLLTSAVLIFMYWLANFVVPAIVSKSFEQDETTDKQKAPAADEEKASTTSGGRGFNNTNRK
ncbi:hypothetical protein Ancab_004409 [Ancistrocladus abbreviatus]